MEGPRRPLSKESHLTNQARPSILALYNQSKILLKKCSMVLRYRPWQRKLQRNMEQLLLLVHTSIRLLQLWWLRLHFFSAYSPEAKRRAKTRLLTKYVKSSLSERTKIRATFYSVVIMPLRSLLSLSKRDTRCHKRLQLSHRSTWRAPCGNRKRPPCSSNHSHIKDRSHSTRQRGISSSSRTKINRTLLHR